MEVIVSSCSEKIMIKRALEVKCVCAALGMSHDVGSI